MRTSEEKKNRSAFAAFEQKERSEARAIKEKNKKRSKKYEKTMGKIFEG